MKRLFLLLIGVVLTQFLMSQTTVTYTEDTNASLLNPERGWYYSWDAESNGLDWYTNHDSPMTLDRLNAIKSAYNVTLIRKYYSLWDFRNGADISADYLTNTVQHDFDVVAQAGMKLICVYIYNWSEDMPIEDASVATMKRHITQLKPYWEANNAQIYAYFGGFIGNDGEWRASSNGNMDNVTSDWNAGCWQMTDAFMTAAPANRMIHLRFPGYTKYRYPNPASASEAFTQTDLARIGFENLGFLYNADDWSTWTAGVSTEAEKRAYIQSQTKYSSSIGEPGGNTTYAQNADVLGTISTYHWSALNMSWPDAAGLITYWKNNGKYDQIGRKLGYRFILKNCTIPAPVKPGNSFKIDIKLLNDGCSGIQNPRKVEIILRAKSGGAKYILNVIGDDATRYNRTFLPTSAETKTLSITGGIPTSMPTGDYDVILNLPDPYASLHDRPEYSIRTANTATWEPSTGYNILGSVTISASASGTAYTGSNWFGGSGGSSDTQAPSVPAGLGASAISQTSFTLSWTASTDNVGVTGYQVYKDGVAYGSETSGTSISISGLTCNTAYSMVVWARDAAGNYAGPSTALNVTSSACGGGADTQAPSVPTGLVASSISSNSFTVTWTPSTDNVGVTGYSLDVWLTSNTTYTSTSASKTITGCAPNSLYYITIYATDAAGNWSAGSSTLTVTTLAGSDTQAPTAPTLSSSAVTQTSFTLSWSGATDNVGITGYQVYKDGVAYGAETSNTSMSITGLTCNTTYSMIVYARDAAANYSPPSTAKSVTTSACGATDLTIQAESYCTQSGLANWTTTIGNWSSGDYAKYCNINLSTGYTAFKMSLATTESGSFKIRKGSATGTVIGTLSFTSTGSWDTYQTKSCTLTGASTTQNIFVTYNAGNAVIDYFTFSNTALKSSDVTVVADKVVDSSTGLYPNPVGINNFLTIKANADKTSHILISDLQGRLVYGNSFQAKLIVPISEIKLYYGIYFVKIETDGQVTIKKLLVQ